MHFARGQGTQGVLLLLVLLAFTARGLLPVGFMPGNERYTLVICTASGPQTIDVGAEHIPAKQQKHKADNDCAFAPLLAQALAATPPILSRSVVTAISVGDIHPATLYALLLIHTYQSRAPPAYSA